MMSLDLFSPSSKGPAKLSRCTRPYMHACARTPWANTKLSKEIHLSSSTLIVLVDCFALFGYLCYLLRDQKTRVFFKMLLPAHHSFPISARHLYQRLQTGPYSPPNWWRWLRLHTPSAGGLGSIPGQGTRSHIPQLQFLCVANKTQCNWIDK